MRGGVPLEGPVDLGMDIKGSPIAVIFTVQVKFRVSNQNNQLLLGGPSLRPRHPHQIGIPRPAAGSNMTVF